MGKEIIILELLPKEKPPVCLASLWVDDSPSLDETRNNPFCGVVSAEAGAGAGIAYLKGGGYKEVIHTIVNALAIISGIICDGAKASCAAKIAASVDAAILGYEMYCQGRQFVGGE